MEVSVNIVCLDVPYPANYGGAINMFHKIRWLHKKGVIIYLHCFEYGNRTATSELNKYCKEVTYYKRNTGISSFISSLPYNVKSRISNELKQNLLKNNYPIIFEALHTCYLL
ncbi:MAG: glycosyltransferase family 1 protein, partial [Bacteroidia bacterium]|nr:glycosyltransferase family 1 protein [Bacteroidia bacterium]